MGSAFRRRLGEVGRTSYVFVVRGFTPGPETEQGPKGSHRLLPTIVPKHELVQIDLKLRFTDAVVRADQPLLHVANGAVRQRHDRGGAFAQVAPEGLRAGYVLDTRCFQVLEAFQAVGVDRRPRGDRMKARRALAVRYASALRDKEPCDHETVLRL